jgi:hypothetical protein
MEKMDDSDVELQAFLDAMDKAVNDPDSGGYATITVVGGKMVFSPGIRVVFPAQV